MGEMNIVQVSTMTKRSFRQRFSFRLHIEIRDFEFGITTTGTHIFVYFFALHHREALEHYQSLQSEPLIRNYLRRSSTRISDPLDGYTEPLPEIINRSDMEEFHCGSEA